MFKQPMVSLLRIAATLSSTLTLVIPQMMNHNRQVAFISYMIAQEAGISLERRKELFLAAVLHDIGAFSHQEQLDNMSFEIDRPNRHSEVGYRLLREFPPFSEIAEIVRFHHLRWEHGKGRSVAQRLVPEASHIIHLADRIAVSLPQQRVVLREAKRIAANIAAHSGNWFKPELIEAFLRLAEKEHFWLDATSAHPTETLLEVVNGDRVEFDLDVLQGLTQIFSQLIDYRSPFTATHSAGVAASAECLARFAGFCGKELVMMRMAGHLHDLGKVTVPTSILEKNGKLDAEEWDIMRAHTFYGFRTLQKIPLMETINIWGSLHHEKLDGSGYPFHLKADELPLGSRIMAVADIFAALTEDRPYRQGMQPQKALAIIGEMVDEGKLDAHVVALLKANLPEIDCRRKEAVKKAAEKYHDLLQVSNF